MEQLNSNTGLRYFPAQPQPKPKYPTGSKVIAGLLICGLIAYLIVGPSFERSGLPHLEDARD